MSCIDVSGSQTTVCPVCRGGDEQWHAEDGYPGCDYCDGSGYFTPDQWRTRQHLDAEARGYGCDEDDE